jgi:serine O-acetyltransferase
LNAPFDDASLAADLASTSEAPVVAPKRRGLKAADSIWEKLRADAAQEISIEPMLAQLYAPITRSESFEEALASKLAIKLGHTALPAESLRTLLLQAALAHAGLGAAARADLAAVVERDPASERLLEPFLFFKGFAAIQTHRLAHWFWNAGRRNLALYLQSRASEVFQTDIHPGARLGKGVFLDHATGFVAGETVVIEDNVSILHSVTLGGTGTQKGDRHPKIRTGVLIGAGAHLIGDIEIGAYSKIAAGSFVSESVPARCTALGVPARIVEGTGSRNPAKSMDQKLSEGTYESFTYVI